MPKFPRLYLLSIFARVSFSLPIALCGCDGFAPTLLGQSSDASFATSVVNNIEFRYPSHLQLQHVSPGDLTRWPIVADLDEEGNLLVLESAGVEGGVAKQLETRPHRLVRLRDDDQDGVFDRRQVVATDLAFPEGVLALGSQILVSAPPQIWSLVDEDGDGVCESRSIWFDGGTLTGCANDLHGPFLGRDGFIYWCKGAFAEQSHELSQGRKLTTTASHIFRRRLEGGPIDVVMTGGMDNPVEMAMLPNGDRFFTSTFLQHPGGGKRDGIVHAIYGGVWGKEHGVIAGHWRTGPLMPITIHLGPAAPSGLAFLDSNALVAPLFSVMPPSIEANSKGSMQDAIEPRPMLAAAEFNLHRISVHALQRAGSSYQADSQTLLESNRIDFHPTDVLEAPDGSLLIIDTGGWYDLCCPSSAVDQAVANGGIYRLSLRNRSELTQGQASKAGSPVTKDKAGGNASDDKSELRRHSSPWVRRRAYATLTPSAALTRELSNVAADSTIPIAIRLDAAWGLCRSAQPQDVEQLVLLLRDKHPALRQVALHAIALHRWSETQAVQECIANESDPHVLRVGLEALGRIANHDAIPWLMQMLPKCQNDIGLRHALLYALMEVGNSDPTAHANTLSSYGSNNDLAVRRAAIWALDQTAPSQLQPEWVWSLIDAAEAEVRQEAIAILSHHPEWAQVLVPKLAAEIDKRVGPIDPLVIALLAEWRQSTELLAWADRRVDAFRDVPSTQQQITLELLQALSLTSLPEGWAGTFAKWISQTSPDQDRPVLLSLLACVSKMELDPVRDRLLIASMLEQSQTQKDRALRVAFIEALPKSATSDPKLQAWVVDDLLESLQTRQAMSSESSAAQPAWSMLERMHLSSEPAKKLAGCLTNCTPLEFSGVLAVLSRTSSLPFQRELLREVSKMQIAKTLAPGFLTQLYRKHPQELRELSKEIEQSLQEPPGDVAKKLDEMLASLPAGDAARGFQVFRHPKHACSACHQLGYVGGSIGPELSKIGATRTRRDLLESILFPSVRFAASYQPTLIQTVDGEVLNGMIRDETPDHVELVIAADKKVQVPVGDIERRLPSQASIMPAGLEGSMSLQDLADLISLLESKK